MSNDPGPALAGAAASATTASMIRSGVVSFGEPAPAGLASVVTIIAAAARATSGRMRVGVVVIGVLLVGPASGWFPALP